MISALLTVSTFSKLGSSASSLIFIILVKQKSASMLIQGYKSLDKVSASLTNSTAFVFNTFSWAYGNRWMEAIIWERSLRVLETKVIFFSMFIVITFWAKFIRSFIESYTKINGWLVLTVTLSLLKKFLSNLRLKKISQTMTLSEKLSTCSSNSFILNS
jgi:hypothetical protein